MQNQRLIHDTATAMAQADLDVVAPCLRDEQRLDALQEFYAVAKAGLEAFCIQQDRIQRRLRPTAN